MSKINENSIEYKINNKIKTQITNTSIDLKSFQINNKTTIILINKLSNRFIYGFINYLNTSNAFRNKVLRFYSNSNKTNFTYFLTKHKLSYQLVNEANTNKHKLRFIFTNILYDDLIIQSWTRLVLYWMHKKKFYDAAWAYLSTLGGAYSSLGEELDTFAQHAEVVSLKQLKLARDFNDPIAILRCKIYLISSYIQLKKFTEANKLLKFERETVEKCDDEKLVNMYIAANKKLILAKYIHKYNLSNNNCKIKDLKIIFNIKNKA